MARKPFEVSIRINGIRKYFGAYATKEEANRKRAEIREQFPLKSKSNANAGKKKGTKDPKVKCPLCSRSTSIYSIVKHYKVCKKRRAAKDTGKRQ